MCVCLCLCTHAAGELLSVAEQFLEQQMHPTVVISAYRQALDDILEALKEIRYAASPALHQQSVDYYWTRLRSRLIGYI